MDLTKFENQIFFTTVRITIPNNDGVTSSIGTGFLFNTPLRQGGLTGTFLVSNKHVYKDPSSSIILNFHSSKTDTDEPELGNIKPVRIDNFADYYYEHPSNEIDLACINVSAHTGFENGVFSKSIHQKFIEPYDPDKLLPGAEVSFIGYPDNRFDATHNLPILRKGSLATLPSVDFNGLKQIVIDAQVYLGSSGSPVFAVVNGHYKLLGVVTQTMIKNSILQTIPTGSTYAVEQPIGLGIVLKTELVIELIKIASEGLSERIDNKH